MNPPIRLLLAVERLFVRQAISTFLKSYKDIQIVGSTESWSELAMVCERQKPDLVIYETDFQRRADAVLIGKILNRIPSAKIVLFSSSKEPQDSLDLIRAGAVGYVSLYDSFEVVVKVIRATFKEGSSLPRSLTVPLLKKFGSRLDPKTSNADLTESETKVIELIAQGKTNKEIAGILRSKLQTVKNHLYHIYKKLGSSNRTQAVLSALSKGFLRK